jgi:hypothetical protein
MDWIGHVTHAGKIRKNSNLTGRGSLEDLSVYRKMIIKWNIKNIAKLCGLDSFISGYSRVVGYCKHGAKLVQSTEGDRFLDQVSDCHFYRKTSNPCC